MRAVAEIVTFPDVQALVVGFLNAELSARGNPARAATKTPNPRPASWVRVDVASGQETNRITIEPIVILQASASSEPAARDLCELVRALLRSMPERDDITAASVMGVASSSMPVPFPDPDIATPRYQSTVQLIVCP